MMPHEHLPSRRPALSYLGPGMVVAALLPFLVTAAAAADEDFFTHLHTEKVMANVTVSPGRAGPVEISIQLETVDERPLAAKAVSVTLTDTQSRKKLETVQAVRIGEDLWQMRLSTLAAGRWMLALGISISDTDKVDVEAPILIASEGSKGEGAAMKHHH